MNRPTPTTLFVLALLSTIMWLVLIPISIRKVLDTYNFLKTAQATTGQIIDFEQVRNGSQKGYPIVRFEVDSQIYQFRSSGSSRKWIGDSVNVLYQPKQPTLAKIGTPTTMWIVPGVFTLMSLFLCPFTISLWKLYRFVKPAT